MSAEEVVFEPYRCATRVLSRFWTLLTWMQG
jgi:hypothetical protein